MLLTTIGGGGGGGGGGGKKNPIQFFFNCLTLLMKMIFNKKFKVILVPSSYFPL